MRNPQANPPQPITGMHAPPMPLQLQLSNESTKKADKFCIEADLLIPGKGDPIRNGCLIIENDKIIHAGKASSNEALVHSAHLPKTHVKVVMPGMWDCHVHLLGLQSYGPAAFVELSTKLTLAGARAARDCMILLDAGFTSVREMGGFGIQLAEAIKEGTLVGPTIYSANSVISPSGGHSDLHNIPKAWHDDACSHGLPMASADGVPECLKAVRMQLRTGAKVIKICTSGGVLSEIDNPIDQQFSDEEIRAMVEEAERARRIVGAHAHGKAGILAALRNGVKTIEHGSFIDEECADLMIEKGAILVATRLIVEKALAMRDLFPPFAQPKIDQVADAHWSAMQLAVKKGVKMAMGTDTHGSTPGSDTLTFSKVGRELGYHVKAGMTPLQAIESATYIAAQTLGPQAPKAGLLAKGYDADFIALDQNPLDDVEVLSEAKHVTHVWKGGKLYKGPGHPVSSI